MKLAFVFSGQGAQYVGMGKTLYDHYPHFKEHMTKASLILGDDLQTIMFEENHKLTMTNYIQPAIFSMSTGIIELLRDHGIESEGSCGLSLGEYSALYDRGVFDFENGLRIIIHRAYYMHETAMKSATRMAALLGDREAVNQAIAAYDDVYAANFNLPNQTVVGGPESSLNQLIMTAKDHGIKRAVMLDTSGAFHTPYMEEARFGFETYLKYSTLKEPKDALYLNTTGNRYLGDGLKTHMIKQITHPVKFYEMIDAMIKDGFDTFVEIGPGKTLTGMIKKIDKNVKLFNIEDVESFNETITQLKEMN